MDGLLQPLSARALSDIRRTPHIARGWFRPVEHTRRPSSRWPLLLWPHRNTLANDKDKRVTVEFLEGASVPFVEVGMGVQEKNGALGGILRVATSTPDQRAAARRHMPFSDGGANNEYSQNIQIADLNALNAALAVIK